MLLVLLVGLYSLLHLVDFTNEDSSFALVDVLRPRTALLNLGSGLTLSVIVQGVGNGPGQRLVEEASAMEA